MIRWKSAVELTLAEERVMSPSFAIDNDDDDDLDNDLFSLVVNAVGRTRGRSLVIRGGCVPGSCCFPSRTVDPTSVAPAERLEDDPGACRSDNKRLVAFDDAGTAPVCGSELWLSPPLPLPEDALSVTCRADDDTNNEARDN